MLPSSLLGTMLVLLLLLLFLLLLLDPVCLLSCQARQSDELSIAQGEELEVIEDGDVEEWVKVSARSKPGFLLAVGLEEYEKMVAH